MKSQEYIALSVISLCGGGAMPPVIPAMVRRNLDWGENPECDGYEILPEDVYDAIVTEEERIDA